MGSTISTYSIFPGRSNIQIRTEIDDIILGANILSPLGIIIYELITNTMKYAFADRNDGVINVNTRLKDDHLFLVFEDNGCGISKDVNMDNSPGFGLQLVRMLIKQINGSLKIESVQGTKFTFKFPV